MAEEDVSIELEDSTLTISGERKAEHRAEGEGYYRVERSTGSFSRSLTLPKGVDLSILACTKYVSGHADVMLAGGADAMLTPFWVAAFDAMFDGGWVGKFVAFVAVVSGLGALNGWTMVTGRPCA